MKKQSDKRRHLPITILTLLFLGSLLYAAYDAYGPFEIKKEVAAPKEIIPKYFDYGVVSDSIYCNDFFGFRIPVIKGHQANYKVYDYIQKGIYHRDSVLAEPQLAVNIGDQDLLLIEPELIKVNWLENFKKTKSLDAFQDYNSEKSKRERFGADYQLIIRAHNLSGASLTSYLNQFENLHHPDYGKPRNKTISGLSFREYQGIESHGSSVQEAMFGLMGGKKRKIISYTVQINGFALSIDLFYQTEEQKCTLLDMVDNIRFH